MGGMKTHLQFFAGILAARLTLALPLPAADTPVDIERAKELFQRARAGEMLTDDEQKYLDEAKRQRAAQADGNAGATDREKMQAVREKMERGDKLSDSEQKIVEQMRRRMADGGQSGGGEFTWERAHAAHAKEQRGEALSDAEKKLLAEARKRIEEGRGPDQQQATAKAAPERPQGDRPPAKDDFDWERARAAHQKEQRGEALTADEKTLLDAAEKRIADGRGPGRAGGTPQRPRGEPPAALAALPKDLVPLTELSVKYKEQDGGLYGGGKNEPPAKHAALARKAIAEIKPLDREGRPAADGKIVLMSIGMSNTTMEFSSFVQLANADLRKAANVVVVDAAQGGKDATAWATSDAPPWRVAGDRLLSAGVSPAQVQAVWIKQALMRPGAGFPSETERLRDRVREIVIFAKQKYPNLRVAYLSSRIYAGYASTALNPEPYSYESGFAVRWLIEEQMKGAPALNADVANGEVKASVLLWGPYLWTNGEEPRKSDGLVFKREDLGGDGTHPSASGRGKVAKLLLDFFTTNELAKTWFTK